MRRFVVTTINEIRMVPMIVCGIRLIFFLEFGLGWARNNCGRPATSAPPSVSLSGTPEASWLASRSIAFQPFLAPFILGTRRMSEAPAATPSKPRVLVADDEQVRSEEHTSELQSLRELVC